MAVRTHRLCNGAAIWAAGGPQAASRAVSAARAAVPGGLLYIVDYGVARVNLARIRDGQAPHEFPPRTDAIWRVTPER